MNNFLVCLLGDGVAGEAADGSSQGSRAADRQMLDKIIFETKIPMSAAIQNLYSEGQTAKKKN